MVRHGFPLLSLDPPGGIMPSFTSQLARWFHDHHGIAASVDLEALGVSAAQRRLLVSSGVLEVLFEGVYHLTSTPLDFLGRCAAVCAADPSLAMSCFSTGRLLGIRRCNSERLHVVTDRVTKPLGRRVMVHRTGCLPPEHLIIRPDGIRHTTPERTFFDLARHVSDLTLISIGEQMLHDGLCTFESLAGVVHDLATRGRSGGVRARRVLASRPEGAPADSHDEVRLLAALHDVGLLGFVRHPPVRLLSGIDVYPDLGDPRVGFYIEVDHHTWHDPSSAADYDKDRDRQIRLVGGTVERVTDTQLETDMPRVVTQLSALYHSRRLNFGGRAS